MPPAPETLTPLRAEAAEPPVEVVSIDTLIEREARKQGISYRAFYATLDCESMHFKDPKLQSGYPSRTGPNGREDSWGIAQIHLPDHPDVSRVEAQDPSFAIPWAAREFKRDPTQWTCYRNL